MSLATDKNGNLLLAYHPGSDLNIPESEQHIPMSLALVAATYQGKVIFIFNTWRESWELPGGIIDKGETPEAAAIREFAEEANQFVDTVKYEGWMKLQLQPDNRIELAVLYSCDLETLTPFEANDEASKMMLWDIQTPVEGDVAGIDHYLAKQMT